MRTLQQFLALALSAVFCVSAASAQTPQREANDKSALAQDVTIIIQPQQVRFIAQKSGEEMHLQIFDQTGGLVFDSGAVTNAELIWPLRNGSGEALKSGLYAYTLSINEAAATARLRRGHFIVDRAQDRDGNTDKLWVTSQGATDVGAELTIAKDENTTIAGTSTRTDNNGARDLPTRTAEEKAGEKTSETKSQKSEAASPTAVNATIGQIAKFTTATVVGDSVMVEANSNIGIGVTAPKHRLSLAHGPLWTSNSWSGAMELDNASAIAWNANGVGQRAGIGHTNGGLLFFRTASDPATTGSPALYDMVITDGGNVGIGTTNPTAGIKLEVNGATVLTPGGTGGAIQFGTPNFETGMTISGSASRGDLRFDGSTLKLVAGPAGGPPASTRGIAINTAGNVGIGTVSPATKLHVESAGFAEMTIKSTNERAILSLSNGLSSATQYTWTLESGVGGQFPSLFGIYNRNVNRPGLTIDGNLLVSVKALDITGGADFAESFDVSTPALATIEPGMVVAIDPAHPGKLNLSQHAYDKRVAGIISGAGNVATGMRMGQTGTLADGQHPVALSGRVYVWADATRGAIHAGDLLTTSATPGHAMKVRYTTKAQGAILGKAMTDLKSGKGLVLVLVTLQ